LRCADAASASLLPLCCAILVGGVGRIAVAVAADPAALQLDIELAAPAASARCRREGHFLLRHGLSPAAHVGPCTAQAPILLLTMGALPDFIACVLLAAADLVIALLLVDNACTHATGQRAAAAFLVSPWTVTAVAAGATSTLTGLVILLAASCAQRGAVNTAAAVLAVGSAVSPDALWMILPVGALAVRTVARGSSAIAASWAHFVGTWALSLGAVLLALACGTRGFAGSVDQVIVAIGRTWIGGGPWHGQPTLGLWWYVMTQAFAAVRQPFAAALHVLPRLCLPSLCLSLEGTPQSLPPCLGVALSLAIVTATKPSPTMPEVILALAMVVGQLDARLLRQTRHLHIAGTLVALGAAAARPWLASWLDARELNANFFYAATLLLAAGQLVLVHDVAAAAFSCMPR